MLKTDSILGYKYVDILQYLSHVGINSILAIIILLGVLQGIFQELDPTLQVQSLLLSLREGFVDKQAKLVCYTDHQLFERFHRYKSKSKSTASKDSKRSCNSTP